METNTDPIEPTRRPRKARALFLIAGAAMLLVLAGAGAVGAAYLRPPTDPYVRALSARLPLPAFSLNGERMTIAEFLREYDALAAYLQAEGMETPNKEVFLPDVLDTLLNRMALGQLAARSGVEIDRARVEAAYGEMAADAGGEEDLAQRIEERFGWSPEEFRERVLEAVVLAGQLSEFVSANSEWQGEARDGIDSARARIASGEPFEVVAGEESEDFSAKAGGRIGYASLGELPASWQEGLEGMEAGDLGPVIDMPDAFVVIRLNDRIVRGEEAEVDLSVLVKEKTTLEDAVDAFLEESEVKRYIARET